MRVFGTRGVFVCSLVLGFISWQLQVCQAQLIGNRSNTLGGPISSPSGRQQPGTRATSSFGTGLSNNGVTAANNGFNSTVSGRFVRGSRSRNDFVGSNRTDQQGFVGATQAIGVGRVPSSVDTLRIPKDRTGNRPVPLQPASGMYYPRLEFDESFSLSPSEQAEGPDVKELPLQAIQNRMTRIAGTEIGLEMVGRLAIVRGQVDSQRQADLLLSLLRFEPGVDEIRSELAIVNKRK
jgi:hypothetical protein